MKASGGYPIGRFFIYQPPLEISFIDDFRFRPYLVGKRISLSSSLFDWNDS